MSAITTTDLNNAQLDVQHIAALATSPALTAVDRMGNTKKTMTGVLASMGYMPPVAYAAGLSMNAGNQTVSYQSNAYAPIVSALPFTTSGAFETTSFRLIQGVTAMDLAAITGSIGVGHGATLNYVAATIGAVLNDVAINVKMFPWLAKGDGVTDDTAAIQAAINFAQTVCGRVLLPWGNFLVSTLHFNGKSGCDFVGMRSGHENKTGSVLTYTGTGNCIEIADGTGAFMYRTFLKDFQIYFSQNANSGVYGKNLQECLVDNVGVWAVNKVVQYAFDLDGGGIINVDNCIMSHTVNGCRMHFGTAPNPQAYGGSSFTRNNIYFTQNALVTGYTLGINIFNNWIEGFETGVLVSNAGFNPRTEVLGLNMQNNFFVQSTTTWGETRVLRIISSNNSAPVRFSGTFANNLCYMNSSGSTPPTYAISLDLMGNTSIVDVHLVAHGNKFIGVSGAAILNDSAQTNNSRCLLIERDNDCRADLFSAVHLPIVAGAGASYGSFLVMCNDNQQHQAPSGTSETTVKTVNIPAYFLGTNGRLRITAYWAGSSNANDKFCRIRVGDLSGTIISEVNMNGSGYSTVNVALVSQNSLTAKYSDSYSVNTAGIAQAGWRQAFSFSSANMVPLLVTSLTTNSADYLTLVSLLVEALPS